MKDFPCFATDDGVASLILKEIPYRQEAYIRFQDVQPGRFAPFLEECVSFCRMAGAEKIYAQGHGELARYPLHAAVYEKEILASGGAYFIHSAGELLGIGWMKDTELLAVCSVKPGAGERVMHTLMSLVEGSGMTMNVASTNEKAIRLYEKLGFLRTAEKVRWYRVG